MTQPSSWVTMSAPMALRPASIAASRSDSLTLSSPAPEITLVPAIWVAPTASTGSSSTLRDARPVDLHVRSHRAQHHLGVVAGLDGLDDRGVTGRVETRQQDR